MNLNTMEVHLWLKVAAFLKGYPIVEIMQTFILKYNAALLLIYTGP